MIGIRILFGIFAGLIGLNTNQAVVDLMNTYIDNCHEYVYQMETTEEEGNDDTSLGYIYLV